MNAPSVSLQEAQAIVETKTAPRVTKESIEAKIQDVQYVYHGTMTIAIIQMHSGFKQVGYAAPAERPQGRSSETFGKQSSTSASTFHDSSHRPATASIPSGGA